MNHRPIHLVQITLLLVLASAGCAFAAATNSVENSALMVKPLPSADIASTLIRLAGAMVLVLAIFLGGFWMTRNWRRFALKNGRIPHLNVFEARSLGARHTLYVVGYDHQRFLVATSPAGITMLATLPPADSNESVPPPGGSGEFMAALVKATQKQ